MKLGIIQPYFFSFIGYFQLINSVDKFVFYDDVSYINRGWINRNNLLVNGKKNLITLSLIRASQNKLINEIHTALEHEKNLITIRMSYSKAPYFCKVFPLIEEIFNTINADMLISEIAGLSIMQVAKYLNLKVKFEYSSEKYQDTKGMDKAARLIAICKKNNADTYINAAGGVNIYSKEEFKKENINLYFIKTQVKEYKQFNYEFVPSLSIIDVMMFNSSEQINIMLNDYILN